MGVITKVVNSIRWKEIDVGHPRASGGAWWFTQAGAMRQLSDVKDGSANSIVQSCFRVLTDAFSEAPVVVVEEEMEGKEETVMGHPLPELIERPNPYMTSDLLWHYYIWSTRVDGNAYLYKVRSAAGVVVELWPLRPDLMFPHAPDNDPNGFIDYYSYRPRGMEQKIPPDDIVHLRIGMDPLDHRKGIGPLKVVLKEVLADEEASRFATSLLSNMAVPGIILAPAAGEMGPDEIQATAIKEEWQEKFGRDKRGEPLISEGPLVPHVVSWSPEQMDFKVLRRVPEERITGLLGVPAIMAGMGAGLESSSGRSESITLVELFTERTIIPDWRRVARQLTWNLLPEFGPSPAQRVKFEDKDIRALVEDQNKVWERVDRATRGGWLMVAEGKRMVGIEPEEGDEVYLRSISTVEVPGSVGMRVDPSGNGAGRVGELANG